MLRTVVLVSGGGTNLQAIIDRIGDGTLKDVEIACVLSNNPGAYALTRAKNAGIPALCLSPKDYETRERFNEALLRKLQELSPDLIVLAGFLVAIPEAVIRAFPRARRQGNRGYRAFRRRRDGFRPDYSAEGG